MGKAKPELNYSQVYPWIIIFDIL